MWADGQGEQRWKFNSDTIMPPYITFSDYRVILHVTNISIDMLPLKYNNSYVYELGGQNIRNVSHFNPVNLNSQ